MTLAQPCRFAVVSWRTLAEQTVLPRSVPASAAIGSASPAPRWRRRGQGNWEQRLGIRMTGGRRVATASVSSHRLV